jgi:hypothetical protein
VCGDDRSDERSCSLTGQTVTEDVVTAFVECDGLKSRSKNISSKVSGNNEEKGSDRCRILARRHCLLSGHWSKMAIWLKWRESKGQSNGSLTSWLGLSKHLTIQRSALLTQNPDVVARLHSQGQIENPCRTMVMKDTKSAGKTDFQCVEDLWCARCLQKDGTRGRRLLPFSVSTSTTNHERSTFAQTVVELSKADVYL